MRETLRLGEATSVAGGAVRELHGVDHAVAIEEVVPGDRLVERIGAVAHVHAVNAFGDFSDNGKSLIHGMLRHRREVPGDLDPGVRRFRERVFPLVRDQRRFDQVQGCGGGFLEKVPFLR